MIYKDLIDGLSLTEVDKIYNSKGSVLKFIDQNSKEFLSFGEVYFSEVLKGHIKAWKFHKKQTQIFVVPVGKIKVALYDSRKKSHTYKKLNEITLGVKSDYFRLKIPPKIWYGFESLVEKSLIVNMTDIIHDPKESIKMNEVNEIIPYKF